MSAGKPPASGEILVERIPRRTRLQDFPDPGLLTDRADLFIGRVLLCHLHVGPERVVKERRELRHHRDVIVKIVGRVIADWPAAQNYLPLLRIVETQRQFEERRLPLPHSRHKPCDFSRRNFERNIVEDFPARWRVGKSHVLRRERRLDGIDLHRARFFFAARARFHHSIHGFDRRPGIAGHQDVSRESLDRRHQLRCQEKNRHHLSRGLGVARLIGGIDSEREHHHLDDPARQTTDEPHVFHHQRVLQARFQERAQLPVVLVHEHRLGFHGLNFLRRLHRARHEAI